MIIRYHPLLLAFFALPIICALAYVMHSSQTLQEMKSEIDGLTKLKNSLEQQKQKHAACLTLLKKYDPHYFDKYLESLPLLESETKRLQALSYYHKENSALAQRLEFLRGGKNKLLFVEGERRQTAGLQEVEEKLQNTIECNDEDLKKILNLLEGNKEGKPQIVVKEFDLIKKKAASNEEVYAIELEIIKRESL